MYKKSGLWRRLARDFVETGEQEFKSGNTPHHFYAVNMWQESTDSRKKTRECKTNISLIKG
jgi:hypothetical protein